MLMNGSLYNTYEFVENRVLSYYTDSLPVYKFVLKAYFINKSVNLFWSLTKLSLAKRQKEMFLTYPSNKR